MSLYAANIADLDGGGRRRRKSSGSVLDTNALVLKRGLSTGREAPKLGEWIFGELPDKSDLGEGIFLRANGSRSFLPVGGILIEAMEG